MKAYRYDSKKTLSWLQAKVERTATALEETNIHCAAGSQSATFVRSSKGKETNRGKCYKPKMDVDKNDEEV